LRLGNTRSLMFVAGSLLFFSAPVRNITVAARFE
jgi:hypothetical protein